MDNYKKAQEVLKKYQELSDYNEIYNDPKVSRKMKDLIQRISRLGFGIKYRGTNCNGPQYRLTVWR